MPAPSKEIQTPVPTGAEHRVVVDGDVDLTTTAHLGRILDEAIARSPATVVVDLTDAGFVGCRGAELLLRSHGALEADGRRMSIRGAHPGLRRSLAICGLGELLDS
ncbi:MAG: STAS domain-containing protein [Pseudonocardia sp.]|nr:STAS domain-containing protein [Pseudonocardia sp.]